MNLLEVGPIRKKLDYWGHAFEASMRCLKGTIFCYVLSTMVCCLTRPNIYKIK
jgi:hypothetical protein